MTSKLLLVSSIFILLCSNVYGAAITNGLIAYYSFNGNAMDGSTNHFDAIDEVSVTYTQNSVNFSDSSSHISLGDRGQFNSMGNLFTIAFWIDSGASTNGVIIDHDIVGTRWDDWTINIRNGAVGFAFMEGSSYDAHNSGSSPIQGGSHHVAIQRDRSTGSIKYFIDGVFDFEVIGGNNDLSASTSLNIGAYDVNGWNTGFSGSLDELYFFNRTLAPSEIQILYQDTNPVPIPSSLILLVTGMLGLAGFRRKSQKSL